VFSVLQCVAVCYSVQCVAVCCSVLKSVAVCYSVLQCFAVRCSSFCIKYRALFDGMEYRVLKYRSPCAVVCCSGVQCVAALFAKNHVHSLLFLSFVLSWVVKPQLIACNI